MKKRSIGFRVSTAPPQIPPVLHGLAAWTSKKNDIHSHGYPDICI